MKQLELHRSRARLVEMERVRGGRVCTKCETWKPREDFDPDKAVKSGMSGTCKACRRERQHRYYEANSERVLEQQRRYREANPEKVRERDRRYREANLEKVRERDRRYYEANPVKVREASRRYYEGMLEGGPSHRLPWLAGEDDLIIAGEYSTVEIAATLGRSEVAVKSRRALLRKKGLMT